MPDVASAVATAPEPLRLAVRPYILAGGRSSRMGRDKAMLTLGGMTLLARTVETLRRSDTLRPADGKTIVTVAGDRAKLEGADRAIADHYPGCGPLGGMEAALRDLEGSGAEWAFFVPVDMPFLGPEAIDSLLREWTAAARCGALVCHAVVDEVPQPLIALVHRTVYSLIFNALKDGRFKVLPVLQSASAAPASDKDGGINSGSTLWRTHFSEGGVAPLTRNPTTGTQHGLGGRQDRFKLFQFSNLNTPEDFLKAEAFLATEAMSEGNPANVVPRNDDLITGGLVDS